jgi:hypothetical protein
MPFKKGHKLSPGRTKGFITQDRKQLMEKAKELNVDVFEILLRFAAGDWKGLGYEEPVHEIGLTQRGEPIIVERIPPELRQKSAKDAAQYILPHLKAIDVTTDDKDKPLNISINLAGPNETSQPKLNGPDQSSTETV